MRPYRSHGAYDAVSICAVMGLLPTYSVTDAAAPIVGDELLLEFRRTFGHRAYPVMAGDGPDGELILGPGWSASLGARVELKTVRVYNVSLAKAIVTDDQGAVYHYFLMPDGSFAPDLITTLDNAALRARLERTGPDELLLTRKFGTKLYFRHGAEQVRTETTSTRCQDSVVWKTTEGVYYRLERVEDRNGNALVYSYEQTETLPGTDVVRGIPLLVTRIEEEGRPEHALEFAYEKIESVQNCFGGKWRLSGVTDPLGRQTHYEYFRPENLPGQSLFWGFLKEVRRPAVYDGENEQANAEPRVQFGYVVNGLSGQEYDEDGQVLPVGDASSVAHVCPGSVTDARGHVTEFSYGVARFPQTVYACGWVGWVDRPWLQSVRTADGQATFQNQVRQLRNGQHDVLTRVTDTRGDVSTSYRFLGRLESSGGSWWVAVNQILRTTSRAGQPFTVAFAYSGDKNGNLTGVTDLSGNVTAYRYAHGPHGYDYALWDQPWQAVVDAGVGGLNLTTGYRYDPTFHKLVERTDAEGVSTAWTLDPASGNRVRMTEAAGLDEERSTQYRYDAEGFLTNTLDAAGRIVVFEKDALGQLARTTRYEGFWPTNGAGRAFVEETVRDALGNVLERVDPNGNRTLYAYDALNRLQTETLPAPEPGGSTSTLEHRYDLNGNETLSVIGNGGNSQATVRRYDARNRLAWQRLRMGDLKNHTEALDYDAGLLTESQKTRIDDAAVSRADRACGRLGKEKRGTYAVQPASYGERLYKKAFGVERIYAVPRRDP